MTAESLHGGRKKNLPKPLAEDTYHLIKVGIYDDVETEVYLNEAEDFAFLYPAPFLDYSKYKPRSEQLGLQTYKKKLDVFQARYGKVGPLIKGAQSVMEIGAAEGQFLAYLHEQDPSINYVALEPDQRTKPARDALSWLSQVGSLDEAMSLGLSVDVIGMYHVFEHIEYPQEMLDKMAQVLAPNGRLVIEVPCLNDPLLSLYQSEPYRDFYFQKQHPYVYTGASLSRVLEENGYKVTSVVPYQRYGLENHLQWLTAEKPGGNEVFMDLFASMGPDYKAALERADKTDTVIVVAERQAP